MHTPRHRHITRSSRTIARSVLTLPVLLAAALLLATPALAVRGHVFSGVLGTPGAGPGQLSEPGGVAVDEATGVVYVTDRAAGKVEYFTAKTGETVPLGEFDGSGTLGEGTAAGSGGGADEEPTGKFVEPDDIAVDNSCRQHRPILTGAECTTFDPSDGDVYVIDVGHDVVDKYTADGKYLGQMTQETLGITSARLEIESFRAVAVTRSGQVLLALRPQTGLHQSDEGVFTLSNGVANTKVGFVSSARFVSVELGVGARPAGGFYLADRGLEPEVLVYGAGGELLSKNLFEDAIAGLAVESCTGDVYLDKDSQPIRERGGGLDNYRGNGGMIVRLGGLGEEPAASQEEVENESRRGEVIEELPVPGEFGAHVAVDCASQTVFVGNAGTGEVDLFGPEPAGPPRVEAGSDDVSEVGSDSARLGASVNPRSEPGEEATSYKLEYGPCPVAGSCVSAGYPGEVTGSLVAGFEVTKLSVLVEGLVPGARYHFRVSAYNLHDAPPAAAEYGEEAVFTTEPSAPVGRLDGRQWELVSEPDKHGASLVGVGEQGVIESSADGSALTYLATAATETGASGSANLVQVLARRGGGGWGSCDIELPHEAATGVSLGAGEEYAAFSASLGLGLVRPAGGFVGSISTEASEVTPFLGDLSSSCGSARTFTPLVSQHNDATGEPFGEEQECPPRLFCGPQVEAANGDLSAVVLKSEQASLVGGVPAGGLYEWYAGELLPVSVLPSGEAVGEYNGAGQKFAPVVGVQGLVGAQSEVHSLRGAVSADGSRVVWSEKVTGGHMFVWDRSLGASIQVDAVQEGGSGAGAAEPVLQFMTPDGSDVFFTDTQRLTANSGAGPNPDLYECHVVLEGEGAPRCDLSDLTPPAGGESANVLGLTVGASESGETAYFVANGTLGAGPSSSGEQPVKGDCEKPSSVSLERCNLFVSAGGRVSLVGVLSGEDKDDWGGENRGSRLKDLTGSVSGSGEWLVFMSDRSLTGYDNDDVKSGQPDEEVFEYRLGGGVVCVSCDPSGARPAGVEYSKLNHGVAGGGNVWPESQWIAGSVPGWTPFRLNEAQYQSRYLSPSGRVFFDSSDSLVASDHNGVEDVYEYEPPGVGSCTTSSVSYGATAQGCIGLVSSGTSGEQSGFLDASENGDDVFFLTAAQLSARDTDTSLDVYDARAEGAPEAEPARPVECQGDGCQSAVAPPEDLTPGSLTYRGSGNPLFSPVPGALPAGNTKPRSLTRAQRLAKALAACQRDRSKAKRSRCQQTARKKYGVARNSKPSRKRK